MPNGVVYEGVKEYAGQGQHLRGETGAQSSIVPALDALFGVKHQSGLLFDYLMEMRDYMPPAHRQFIELLERGPSLRPVVESSGDASRLVQSNGSRHWRNAFHAVLEEASG
jgi:indoleamine 2,3-dioxygenase